MQLTRRAFLAGVSTFALTAASAAREYRGGIPWEPGKAVPPPVYDPEQTFLTSEERAFVTAAVDRLIPADEYPSASELGVVDFIDHQLAGPFGRGDIYYMEGPFRDGLPTQGYQAQAPALLYRQAIADIRDGLAAAGQPDFIELPDDEKDTLLTRLSKGEGELSHTDGKTFFDTLWQNTQEGYFGDPVYGGNRNMEAWRMINFPGARYDYRPWIDHGGEAVILDPVSVGGRMVP
ncbi:gluconate 2-dehydrogenase subunit 3 family protein [Palleronia sp. LCG004]|uniref:gluconate 2-dehydrogenase subunit 3 family protein n=1 Tax=Palleronia sp. LCG004 TaxID=3079304 RepID=UPI002943E0EC|nr:gluconate 2-dehydrogenase subunit 3 family protein [Palleronia sp. LCG004]WOI56622.1 gluconate 2-dehydrogenase subunit 3 family protein [Palleronia sp. LCG004]